MEKNQSGVWGIVVEGGQKVELTPPEDVYVLISNVCFGEVKDSSSSSLIAFVDTVSLDEMKPEDDYPPETKVTCKIATLSPAICEHQSINQLFSPLSKLELECQGSNSIHVSGYYIDCDNNSDEEVEGDFVEEDEAELEKSLMKQL